MNERVFKPQTSPKVIASAVLIGIFPVSYTHLTLPTKRIV